MARSRERRARLPGEGWLQRLLAGARTAPSRSSSHGCARQVLARAPDDSDGLRPGDATRAPVTEPVLTAALALDRDLPRLQTPMRELAKRLAKRLDEEADVLDSSTRLRIDAMVRGITRRGRDGGRRLARHAAIAGAADAAGIRRLVRDRAHRGARARCRLATATGSTRPSPSSTSVAKPAHGVVVTSATLTDGSGERSGWAAAEAAHRRARICSRRPCACGCLAVRLRRPDARLHRHRRAAQRHGPDRLRLSRAVPGGGRRRARPVHRHRAAARRARAHRAGAGAGRPRSAGAACRRA